MIYIKNTSDDPYYNLALEEFAFEKLRDYGDIFILWINKPTIVVGRFQNTIEEINHQYVEENDVKVVRRNSGGGAVYHDYGNLNYTIISSQDSKSEGIDFAKFAKPIVNMLAELDITAEFGGRNDIAIAGKKICGNAQYFRSGRVLHHGCILFDVDLEKLQESLRVSKDKYESKGLKSVRSRVDNIAYNLKEKFDNNEFKDRLQDYMLNLHPEMVEYVLSDEDIQDIKRRRDTKFSTWDWTFGKSPKFNVSRNRKFNGGKIESLIDVKDGIIESVKFYGDFFSMGEVCEFEEKLRGVKYHKNEVQDKIMEIGISTYFPSFSESEILEVLID